MVLSFNCYRLLDSVKLAYIDTYGDKITKELASENGFYWELKESDKLNISHYAFIVNDQFWVCDTYNNTIVSIYDGFFSDFSTVLLPKPISKLKIVHDVFCSDLSKDSFEPINPKSSFNNLDYTICYWSEISGVLDNALVIFQIIDPNGNLYFMDHELLQENKKNGIRNYYAIFKTSSKLISGEWTFELIYQNEILCSKKLIYNILKNSYSTKESHFDNHTSFRVDIKT